MSRGAIRSIVLLAVFASPGAEAQAPEELTPALDHESAALAALEASPTADEIPLRARVLDFPEASGASLVALVADLPSAAPSVRADDDGTYTQDFTVLGLVREASGRIVYRSSRRYTSAWTRGDQPDLEARRTLFESETHLPPGEYSVEIAARDGQGGALGVARLPLDLPPTTEEQLRLSSLVVVGPSQRAEPGASSPLLFDGALLYPNLGDPVHLSEGKPLTFLFTLRPGARLLASASVEVLRDGRGVVQSPVVLQSPDPSGQMRVVSGLQVGELEPGDYTLRLTISHAQGVERRSVPFTLAP